MIYFLGVIYCSLSFVVNFLLMSSFVEFILVVDEEVIYFFGD